MLLFVSTQTYTSIIHRMIVTVQTARPNDKVCSNRRGEQGATPAIRRHVRLSELGRQNEFSFRRRSRPVRSSRLRLRSRFVRRLPSATPDHHRIKPPP